MTGLRDMFNTGIMKRKDGLYHCDACAHPLWYADAGECPNCEEDMVKLL